MKPRTVQRWFYCFPIPLLMRNEYSTLFDCKTIINNHLLRAFELSKKYLPTFHSALRLLFSFFFSFFYDGNSVFLNRDNRQVRTFFLYSRITTVDRARLFIISTDIRDFPHVYVVYHRSHLNRYLITPYDKIFKLKKKKHRRCAQTSVYGLVIMMLLLY